MWAAFKQGYYEAGGPGPLSIVATIFGNIAKGATYTLGGVLMLKWLGWL